MLSEFGLVEHGFKLVVVGFIVVGCGLELVKGEEVLASKTWLRD